MRSGNSVALYLPSISGDNDVIAVASVQQAVKYHRGHRQVTLCITSGLSRAVIISQLYLNILPPELYFSDDDNYMLNHKVFAVLSLLFIA